MKAILISLTLLCATGAAFAGESKKAESRKATKSEKQKTEVVTGSQIPQKYQKNGRITTSSSQLVVIDRKAIERSGASDLAGVLRRSRPY